jgi:hypothetical protein
MFWSKKKEKRPIKDPVAKYGEMLRDKKGLGTKGHKNSGLLDKLFKNGHDSGFVFYED